MKKFTYTAIALFAILFGTALNAKADDLSEFESRVKATDWAQYAVEISEFTTSTSEYYGKEFYICMDNGTGDNHDYRFIDAGGAYGSEAVLGTRGIRFTATKPDSYYLLDAAVNNNNKSYFGTYEFINEGGKTFFDCTSGDGYAKWTMYPVGSSGKDGYNIYNNGKYMYISYPTSLENVTLASNDNKSVWYFVPVDKFHDVAKGWDGEGNTLVDLSGLVYNSHFTRNATSTAWEFYTFSEDGNGTKIAPSDDGSYDAAATGYNAYLSINPTLGTSVSNTTSNVTTTVTYGNDYVDFKGCYGAAEIQKSIIMRQNISNIPAGTYIVTAQAFFYDPDNTASSDAYFFAANTTTDNEKRTNGVSIKALSEKEYSDFEALVKLHKDNMKKVTEIKSNNTTQSSKTEDISSEYFRYNVPAAEFMAQYNNTTNDDYSTNLTTFNNTNYYNLDEEYKRISVEVTVTEGGTLTVGFAKTSDTGYAFLDNVKLYYTGVYEFGIDAYNTTSDALEKLSTEGVDENQYTNERRFNLSRDFGMDDESKDTPKWQPIVLPVDLSASEIKNALGDNVKLAKLNGISGTTIVFDEVDLSDDTQVALYAGECYVIKVTKAPTVAKGSTYSFYRCGTDKTNNLQQTYYGPVYHIAGVNRKDDLATLLTNYGCTFTTGSGKVTKSYTTSDGTLEFNGFFYDTYNDGAPAGSYVVHNGNMYHLSSQWNGIVGTSWYLQTPTKKAMTLTIADGKGSGNTSEIISVVAPGESTPANGNVYNLNGQKVSSGASLNGLAKGVYIMNGRKYVVK